MVMTWPVSPSASAGATLERARSKAMDGKKRMKSSLGGFG
jgi:hypothetical protein